MTAGEAPGPIIVIYTTGAVRPLELAADMGEHALVFACRAADVDDSEHDLLHAIAPVIDLTDEESGLAELAALRPSGILAFSDQDLALAARVAARLGLRFHTEDVALALTDKSEQRCRLAGAGLRTPRFRIIGSPGEVRRALEHVGTPAVLKPVVGSGSRHTYRIAEPSQADRFAGYAFSSGGDTEFLLEEELIGDPGIAGEEFGDYVSVELLLLDGQPLVREVTGRLPLTEPFREVGLFIPSTLRTADRAAVEATALDACRALGLRDGWVHAELKLTADGPAVIEVNGRIGGYIAVLLRRATGLEAIRAAMDVAVGNVPALPPPAYLATSLVHLISPPIGARRLLSVGEFPQLGEIPQVLSVVLHARPGGAVDWRLGTPSSVGAIEAIVDGPQGVLALTRAIKEAMARELQYGWDDGAAADRQATGASPVPGAPVLDAGLIAPPWWPGRDRAAAGGRGLTAPPSAGRA